MTMIVSPILKAYFILLYLVSIMDLAFTVNMNARQASKFVFNRIVVLDTASGKQSQRWSQLERFGAESVRSLQMEAVTLLKNRLAVIARNHSYDYDVYRRIDGIGNNREHPHWGASLHTEPRLLPNAYDDGKGVPRINSVTGKRLPSARTISRTCFQYSQESGDFLDKQTSQLMFQFGQYIDHEIIATEIGEFADCCNNYDPADVHPDVFLGGICFPITIEPNDRFFNTTCMNFKRAFGVTGKDGVREQLNVATGFIDGSNVYGSSVLQNNDLRLFHGGRQMVNPDNMLPLADTFPCLHPTIPNCPNAGKAVDVSLYGAMVGACDVQNYLITVPKNSSDSRVSEFPGLTALHTVFLREHNRVADQLYAVNPHWSDERLFQEARKIIIAIHQKIIIEDFLPLLIGPDVMQVMGIDRPYKYDPTLDPSISNEFGVAAFRAGHNLINGQMHFEDEGSRPISELFFRPENVLYRGESVLRGVIMNQADRFGQRFDTSFTNQVLDKLFLGVDAEAAPGESFDLMARNIQRSRDHGIRPYIDYLDYCSKKLSGLKIPQLTIPTCLFDGAYESIRDVELFVGGSYETPLPGATVGPTFACIIGEQFRRLKFGDRFYYETPDKDLGFTKEQLYQIKSTTSLSAVICRNVNVFKIQPNAFGSRKGKGNKHRPCYRYPDINFAHWKEHYYYYDPY